MRMYSQYVDIQLFPYNFLQDNVELNILYFKKHGKEREILYMFSTLEKFITQVN